jgi:hypothetical protein
MVRFAPRSADVAAAAGRLAVRFAGGARNDPPAAVPAG